MTSKDEYQLHLEVLTNLKNSAYHIALETGQADYRKALMKLKGDSFKVMLGIAKESFLSIIEPMPETWHEMVQRIWVKAVCTKIKAERLANTES